MVNLDPVADRARALLLKTRNADGGWPYYAGRSSRLEPTAWALLTLGDASASDLLLRWKGSSGLLVEPQVGSVNFGFNAIATLALAAFLPKSSNSAASDVARALLAHRGERGRRHPATPQNPDLQGWAWMSGTFTWVEPTAWCLLAVKKVERHAPQASERIAEAELVLFDRACSGGGWNYGNAEVYGKHLPAHVPPTAAGILALQDRPSDSIVQRAIAFLGQQAVAEGSTTALALSWLALSVVGTTADDVMAALATRLSASDETGNLAAIAMALYVLERHANQTRPQAFVL